MAVTEGNLRLYASDASMSRKDLIYGDVRTEQLDISTDPRQMQVVPYTVQAVVKEDDVIIVALKGDTAGNFDSASTLRVPVTIKNMTTGITRSAFLSLPDFTDMAGAAPSATNIEYGTNYTDVLKYTVKAQERLILGHKFAENSRIYVALVVA
jgi:hypothetical protein